MAYVQEPGLIPDAQNPAAQRYALFRLHQQAALGQITPEEIAAAQQDPTAWWRAYTASLGGVIPQQNILPAAGGPIGGPLTPAGLAQHAAGPHRFSPSVHVSPRQAVMNRLTGRYQTGASPYHGQVLG
jgi:hypothetical protein